MDMTTDNRQQQTDKCLSRGLMVNCHWPNNNNIWMNLIHNCPQSGLYQERNKKH